MSPLATDTTDTYLDVLRTLGVSDAELRRHHGVGPDEPLRAAIAAALDSPTDDLLGALAATGRVLRTDEELSPADGERLAAALGRFGYVLEVSSVEDDLELLVHDAVRDEETRLRTDPDREAVRASLEEALLEPAGIEFVPLLDGRLLVVDATRLEGLRVAYGPRIEPFETPLLPPETDLGEPADEDRSEWAGGAAAAERAGVSGEPAEESASRPGEEPVRSDAEILDGPDAGNDPAEGVAASFAIDPANLGGGPRQTVSTAGIDEVFDQLEDDAAASAGDEPPAASTTTSSVGGDPLADLEHADDAEGGLAGGGPDRTVSRTSADDILDRASGGTDFETVAEQADPDTVRDDAAEVSELAAAVADVQSDPGTEEPSVDELVSAAEESTGDDADGVLDGDEAECDDGVLDHLESTLGG